MVILRSTFVDHRAIIGKVRIETTWTYKRKKDGQKRVKYRKARWRIRNTNGGITNKAHYVGRVENGEFIPSSGARTEDLAVDRAMAS